MKYDFPSEEIKNTIIELRKDLANIISAACNGSVPVSIDSETGEVYQTAPYTMTTNAYLDLVGLEMSLDKLAGFFKEETR